jgi:hypothetical protein
MRHGDFRGWIGVVALTLLVLPAPGLQGQDDKPAPEFVGVGQCTKCHNSKATGQQVQVWLDGPHSKAYQTLGTQGAAIVGAKYGITDPQNSLKCLRCHTTASGEPKSRLGDDFDHTKGVQCESCHGPGEEYARIECMIQSSVAAEAGLVDPGPTVCARCHNEESPVFEGFEYKTAVKKIRHNLASY